MWVRGGHQFVLFPKGDKELSWHFQALLPTFVFFLLSQQQIVSLFSVLAEFYCTNYWDLFFSVSKSFKSQVLVNSIDTFLTFQFQEVEKSCQWISHREKSLEKLEKKSQKRGLLYYQKKGFSLLVFSPLVSDLPVHTLKQFENPSQISQGDHQWTLSCWEPSLIQANNLDWDFIFHLPRENVWFNINQQLWESKIKMRSNWEESLTYSSLYLSDLKMQISKCKIRISFFIGVQRPEF